MRIWFAIPFLFASATFAAPCPPDCVSTIPDAPVTLHLGPAAEGKPDFDTTLNKKAAEYGIHCEDTECHPDTICDHIPNCSIYIRPSIQQSPVIATLGPRGCIVGPFKLFDHDRTVFEIPANAEYPVGCREER